MQLETERLILQLYSLSDKENFIELITDESVMKHVDTGVLTFEKAENLWIKLTENFYPQGINTIFAVFTKKGKKFIGNASLRPRPEKKEDWEIGYILRSDEWGKGFATEIAQRLIDFGFDELKLSEVFATIDDENYASIKVAEKAGMRFLCYEFDEQGRFSIYSISANQ